MTRLATAACVGSAWRSNLVQRQRKDSGASKDSRSSRATVEIPTRATPRRARHRSAPPQYRQRTRRSDRGALGTLRDSKPWRRLAIV